MSDHELFCLYLSKNLDLMEFTNEQLESFKNTWYYLGFERDVRVWEFWEALRDVWFIKWVIVRNKYCIINKTMLY